MSSGLDVRKWLGGDDREAIPVSCENRRLQYYQCGVAISSWVGENMGYVGGRLHSWVGMLQVSRRWQCVGEGHGVE